MDSKMIISNHYHFTPIGPSLSRKEYPARFRSKLCPDVPSSPVFRWSFLTQFIACVFRTKLLKNHISGYMWNPHISPYLPYLWKLNEVESHWIPIFFSRFLGSTAPRRARPRHPGDSQLATPQGSESRRGGLWGFLLKESRRGHGDLPKKHWC